ncbi:phosphopentomutase [Flammeovirga kamogawensis]|uniref:phosphopentomutase n=1 Tax=Flammeovirga kamogawensis TaxID=373891 RepID=UPI0011825422|nr:phosphopentomutase [Flammeovirga kamogawensis]MBB6460702.1 phosphopentomutase [Flammeovirga kamogawensis]TRX69862.1 phosphopentomutase [Flammeovirga kamogawensis]
MINRVALIVLDSVGIGFSSDADEYGDRGANTLGHIADSAGLDIPNMHEMGLGNIAPLHGLPPMGTTSAAYGKAKEVSKGKDTTTGHWEIAGQILSEALPTYPNGFPAEIMEAFEKETGKGTIGNIVASGTAIINELGDEHVATGKLIIYTSADSVFQIAAHEDIVPLEDLYRYCEIARKQLNVGRVIARPFIGKSGNYERTSNRHDYSLEPAENMLTRIIASGKDSIGIGKIYDIYAGKGFTDHTYTKSNSEGIDKTIEFLKQDNEGLIFTNLVDFDMLFGHRRDLIGYRDALEYFDQRLPEITAAMKDDDILIITADHGNDPIFKGTDHTREHIPILVFGKKIKPVNIGFRSTFADIGTTIEELLLNEAPTTGSFASMII